MIKNNSLGQYQETSFKLCLLPWLFSYYIFLWFSELRTWNFLTRTTHGHQYVRWVSELLHEWVWLKATLKIFHWWFHKFIQLKIDDLWMVCRTLDIFIGAFLPAINTLMNCTALFKFMAAVSIIFTAYFVYIKIYRIIFARAVKDRIGS